MTHSKLVKTVNRKTHPQNCPYQSWRLGRLMLRCGDHSRSRPVDCLAAELSPLIENLAAVYGRETDLKELLPFPIHCPACQNRLAECRSSAAAAIIVDLAAIVEKQHVALRRRCPSCPDFGVLLAQLQCPCRAARFSWKATRLPLLHAIFCFWL